MPIISRGSKVEGVTTRRATAFRLASTSTDDFPCSRPARLRTRRWTSGTSPSTARSTSAGDGRGTSCARCERDDHRRHQLRDEVTKLDTVWEGVSVDTCWTGSRRQRVSDRFLDGGYTTNLPARRLTGGQAWIAFAYDVSHSRPSTAARRGSWCRICYFWRVPSGCAGSASHATDGARLLGVERLPQHYGDPWKEQRYWGD